MTLIIAFSNFEFFFFHFQKGFMLVYSREILKCCFSFFFFFAVPRILLTDRKLALCFVTFVKNYSCNEEIVHIFKLYSCNIF